MASTTTLTKLEISTKSSRSLTTAPIIVKLDSDIGCEIQVEGVPTLPSPTQPRVTTARPLRRRKHLSIYRASAPAQSPVAEAALQIPCVQRPQSMISPSSVMHESSPLTRPVMHSRSQSQPNVVRLGHPSRPYYSAIRKNMSRPNSPSGDSSMNLSRPASMVVPSHVSSLIRSSSPTSFGYLPHTFDDTDDEELFASPPPSHRRSSSRFSFGLGGFSSPASALHSGSGSSASGEMEMRMALAALAREAQQSDSSFQFEETGKLHASVSWRVKQLGKGLKDLVRRKHAC